MDDPFATTTREQVVDSLDDLVLDNRFTIAVVFPVTGAFLLTASALQPPWLPDALAFNPLLILLGTLVMRLPLIAGLAPLIDRKAAAALGVLTVYAYAIEFVGLATGWPYGEFVYGVSLGPMLAGEVPLGLPIFFVPLVVNSYLLCTLVLGERAASTWVRLPAVIATVIAVDLVLDPGAVALGFWDYGGGAYYGVPWSNFEGWMLSATVAVIALDRGFAWADLRDRLHSCSFMLDDMVSFVILWGAINAVFGNWVPVAIALLFGLGLVVTDRFDVPTRPRWMDRCGSLR